MKYDLFRQAGEDYSEFTGSVIRGLKEVGLKSVNLYEIGNKMVHVYETLGNKGGVLVEFCDSRPKDAPRGVLSFVGAPMSLRGEVLESLKDKLTKPEEEFID